MHRKIIFLFWKDNRREKRFKTSRRDDERHRRRSESKSNSDVSDNGSPHQKNG